MAINKMERFTKQTWRILEAAETEAKWRWHEHIETEHILLAMLQPNTGLYFLMAGWLGIDYPFVEEQTRKRVQSLPALHRNIPQLMPDTKRVIELAVQEMRQRKHPYVHPEHLVLGIAQLRHCTAMKILGTFGIDARELRRQTERALEIRKDEVNKPSASPPQPQIGGFRLIQGTEGKK